MSTILDALKKVEEEKDSTTGATHQRQLNALQHTSARPPQRQGARLIKWGGLALVGCLLTGLTLYLFLPNRHPSTEPVPEQAQVQPRPALTRERPLAKPAPPPKRAPIEPPRIQRDLVDGKQPGKPAMDAARSGPAQRPTERPQGVTRPDRGNPPSRTPDPPPAPQPTPPAPVQPQPAPSPQVAQPAPQRQPAPAPQVGQPAPQRQDAPQPPPPPTPPASQGQTLPQPSAPAPASRPAPSPKKQTPSPSNAYSSATRLTDGSIKIQAIAWSQSEEERMAVINSKIVREGSNVDEYVVVAIQPDEVIVRKGGQMYKAIFGRP